MARFFALHLPLSDAKSASQTNCKQPLAELAKNYQPDAPTATPQYFDLSPQDLAAVTAQAEQGSPKAVARLAEYYQFTAHGLPDLPENEREAKAEYWQKRAQEAQAK